MEWFKSAGEDDFKKHNLKSGSIVKIKSYFNDNPGDSNPKGLHGQELKDLLKKMDFTGKKLNRNFQLLNNQNLTMEWFKSAQDADFKKFNLKSGSISKIVSYFNSHKESNDPYESKGLHGQELKDLLEKIGFTGTKLNKNFELLNNKNLTMEWFKSAGEDDFKKHNLKSGSIVKIKSYFNDNPGDSNDQYNYENEEKDDLVEQWLKDKKFKPGLYNKFESSGYNCLEKVARIKEDELVKLGVSEDKINEFIKAQGILKNVSFPNKDEVGRLAHINTRQDVHRHQNENSYVDATEHFNLGYSDTVRALRYHEMLPPKKNDGKYSIYFKIYSQRANRYYYFDCKYSDKLPVPQRKKR